MFIKFKQWKIEKPIRIDIDEVSSYECCIIGIEGNFKTVGTKIIMKNGTVMQVEKKPEEIDQIFKDHGRVVE